MELFDRPEAMQAFSLGERAAGRTIALVPTMGNLHAGHQALLREARSRCDTLIASIFVNPTQFGPGEDFERYPRTFQADLDVCAGERVDAIFAPSVETMYGEDRGVVVEVGEWSQRLCGASRPGHFTGVATVVLKLFNICQPHRAVFGWKDAQQFLILRRMARALNVPVEPIGVETIREPDGLALSSRNHYLSAEERAEAPALFQALCQAKQRVESGEKDAREVVQQARQVIVQNTHAAIDYVEAVDMDTLQPLRTIQPGRTLLAAAVRYPSARLIDNIRM